MNGFKNPWNKSKLEIIQDRGRVGKKLPKTINSKNIK